MPIEYPDIVMKQAYLHKDRKRSMNRVGKTYNPQVDMVFGPIKLRKPYATLTAEYQYKGARGPVLRLGGCVCSPRYALYGRWHTTSKGKYNNVGWQDPRAPLTNTCSACSTPASQKNKPMVCEWCGFQAVVDRQIHGDHIMPRGKGGLDIEDNIQWLCANCHELKTTEDYTRYGRAGTW